MPVQPNLFPEPGAPPKPHPAVAAQPRSGTAPLWLQRISLFILVLFCVYLGIIVAILPWWTSVWDHNLFFQSRPWLWSVLRLGAVRGIISGLGLLDIWIGISEAIHYRDDRP
ncbi:hypothetical protein [Granulicella tundricola]|uniref:Uncharacterized protein n=1 Tax=Granulicella tundricola (strain ATCC BAA-1859 / DSM 23138 / MP5ACTX9) TaxID=1198114 RepID=E8X4T4_GRATM|nr:hypothetical protein [Granulicella tundricola]ADW70573.1 hypothetical protein AciX9_3569 [Granulicella tundricola MP5ACTX9]